MRSSPRAKYPIAATTQSAIGSACTAAELVNTTPVPARCGRLAPIPAVPLCAPFEGAAARRDHAGRDAVAQVDLGAAGRRCGFGGAGAAVAIRRGRCLDLDDFPTGAEGVANRLNRGRRDAPGGARRGEVDDETPGGRGTHSPVDTVRTRG